MYIAKKKLKLRSSIPKIKIPPTSTMKACEGYEESFWWVRVESRWRLVDGDGTLHSCESYHRKKGREDDGD